MGFSIQDIEFKRKYKGSTPLIFPYFLTSADHDAIDKTLNLVAQQILNTQIHDVSLPMLEAIWKNYKMSRAMRTLLFYHFITKQTPKFEAVFSERNVEALQKNGITNASTLRLYLFTYLEKNHHGFLSTANRTKALTSVGRILGLSMAQLERGLTLDYEENQVLTPIRSPTTHAIIELFNFHVLDTIFRQGYKLIFSIDGQLTGTLVKTFCMLAKRKSIVYDITRGGESRFFITLYGPFEVFGKVTKYGSRLSEVALHFLTYLISTEKKWNLEAEIILFGKKYLFLLMSNAFPSVAFFENYKGILQESNPTYDSSVEAQFVRRFSSNDRGWELVNEPEPLLFDGNVMVPDFVAQRGKKRVFIEVIGYWRPEYKSRKRQKLALLAEKGYRLVLLVDKKFQEDFPPNFAGHAVLFYSKKTAFNMTQLLAILDVMTHRHDLIHTSKLNQGEIIDLLLKELNVTPFLSIGVLKELLQCYTESEIIAVLEPIMKQNQLLQFIPQLGLFTSDTINDLVDKIRVQIKTQETPLSAVTNPLSQETPPFNLITFIEWTRMFEISWNDLHTPTISRKTKRGRLPHANNTN